MKSKTVLVGMSGGVDSSVTAALLLREGYTVIGGFIKNWSDAKDAWTGECNWRGERRDAMRVCAKLGIPMLTFDFEKTYREKIISELFSGYASGSTPNPDVLCNEYIKFGLFFEEAKRLNMAYVATGHYAQIRKDVDGMAHMLRGVDPEKDQSYFLYRIPQAVLRQVLFPIGIYEKSRVRELAAEFDLPTADKPDSQGICFIGKLDMQDFLRTRIQPRKGNIISDTGEILGTHEGIDGFTIGQRHGIRVSHGEEPWYVAEKNVEKNEIIVVQGSEHPKLFRRDIRVGDVHWMCGIWPNTEFHCLVQVRYRQKPISATAKIEGEILILHCHELVKAIATGQSAVVYDGDECLGGGVILG